MKTFLTINGIDYTDHVGEVVVQPRAASGVRNNLKGSPVVVHSRSSERSVTIELTLPYLTLEAANEFTRIFSTGERLELRHSFEFIDGWFVINSIQTTRVKSLTNVLYTLVIKLVPDQQGSTDINPVNTMDTKKVGIRPQLG